MKSLLNILHLGSRKRSLWQKIMHVWKTYWKHKKKSGFTMIEVMIAVTIVGAMSVMGVVTLQASQSKARDAQRKADLEKIKIALEDYYNDNGCYPPEGTFEICGSDAMAPYLAEIPCDPITDDPYPYVPLDGATCSGYRLFSSLEDENDPSIMKVGCDAGACGSYNYGISSGVVLNSEGGLSAGGGDVPLGEFQGLYACAPGGICNVYDDPVGNGCPASFAGTCADYCDDPDYWCTGG